MNNPLNRKMFREAGMSKQPMGILASSPELMTTAQQAMASGQPVRAENGFASFMNKNQDSIYPKNLTTYNERNIPSNKSIIADPDVSGQTPLAVLKAKKEAETAEQNKGIDTSLSQPSINDTNKKIIEGTTPGEEANKFNVKKLRPSFMSKPSETDTSSSDAKGSGLKDFKSQLSAVTEIQKNAVAGLTSANATADEYKLGGKTVEKRMDDFTTLVNRQGKEPTLADVKDDAIQLLGFDPDQLDEQYDEDKQASIWLNMMKAGLAVASGESSNALTNIAKGFSFGLDQYGKDIGKLKTELKADRKDAANTMYKLLKDEKSERLAKKTLEIQQEQGLLNIQMKYVGNQKTRAMAEYNMKMDGAKWNVSMISTLAKMDGDEQTRAFQKDNLEKTFKLALVKATPKEVVFLRQSGDLKLKPGITEEIPFGSSGYFDQFDVTPKGKKALLDMSSTTKSTAGSNTDFKFSARDYSKMGKIGAIYIPNIDDIDEGVRESFGTNAATFQKTLQATKSNYDKLPLILAFASQQNAKVRINDLTVDQQEQLKQEISGGKKGDTLLKRYSNILVR